MNSKHAVRGWFCDNEEMCLAYSDICKLNIWQHLKFINLLTPTLSPIFASASTIYWIKKKSVSILIHWTDNSESNEWMNVSGDQFYFSGIY